MKQLVWDFQEVGRLPAPGDNVAMATRRLEAGTRISREGSEITVGHTVLEGHRFAVEPIAEGQDLLSWGLRFGRASAFLRLPAAKKTPRGPRTRAVAESPEGMAMPA